MAEASNICLAILAAGASSRFGRADKLVAILQGKMLGLHVAHTLADVDFARMLVIARQADHACASQWARAGYEICENPRAANGMGTSVSLAAGMAKEASCQGLLICLADMPFVGAAHISRLIETFDLGDPADIVASSDGATQSPPAIFGSVHFESLLSLDDDRGARDLIGQARAIETDAHSLADIDDPVALARYNASG